jgi:hypothetical protein
VCVCVCVCLCVCVCVCVCMCACMCMCMHTYIHTYTHTYIHAIACHALLLIFQTLTKPGDSKVPSEIVCVLVYGLVCVLVCALICVLTCVLQRSKDSDPQCVSSVYFKDTGVSRCHWHYGGSIRVSRAWIMIPVTRHWQAGTSILVPG